MIFRQVIGMEEIKGNDRERGREIHSPSPCHLSPRVTRLCKSRLGFHGGVLGPVLGHARTDAKYFTHIDSLYSWQAAGHV